MSKPVLIINGKKKCSLCKQLKSVNCFGKNKYAKNGLTSECRECKRIYNSKRERQNPKLQLKNHLKHSYGITLEQYDQMFEQQNGVCKICGGVNPNGKRLYVDHNHETGKIRGLLCANCNLTLGCVKENLAVLASMINYLQ